MLSKRDHTFYHACRYIVTKTAAEVLEYDGVRGHDCRLMADDLLRPQQQFLAKQIKPDGRTNYK